jgi:hypothetical protein
MWELRRRGPVITARPRPTVHRVATVAERVRASRCFAARMSAIDAAANALGRSQHGQIARRQLREAGVDRRAVRRRLDAGVWTEPVPRVIDTGTHPPSWRQELMRVVLAAGPEATVSHRCAAHLLGFLDVEEPDELDVTVPRGRFPQVGEVRLHTVAEPLPDEEVVEVDGFRCTSSARTLLDLAATLAPRRLEAILWDAARRDPKVPIALAGVLARHPRARGRRGMKALLGQLHPQVAELASPLEVEGVLALDRAGAPRPRLQHVVRDETGRFVARVDAAWPTARVIVEFDGVAYHDHPGARARDEQRLARLRSLGWEVHVLTADDLRRPARLRRIVERIRTRTAMGLGRENGVG